MRTRPADAERKPAKRRLTSRPLRLAAIALPPIAFALLVGALGSDVVFWDEWYLVELLVAAKRGTLAFSDFLAFHTVHRMLLPKIILTRLAMLTHWNVRVELIANVALATISYSAILVIARRQERRVTFRAAAAAALTIFSLSQYENWLWGWQLSWFLSVAFVVSAIAIVSAASRPFALRFIAAAVLCAAATSSIAFGAVAWIALLPLLWVESGRRYHVVGLWLLTGALCVAAYLAGDGPFIQQGTTPSGSGIVRIILFFVAVAGTPWTTFPIPALLLGAASLAAWAIASVAALRANARAAAPWFVLGLFALGFAGLSAIVRSQLGWETSLSSRYATPMVLLVAATYFLATIATGTRTLVRAFGRVLIVALVVANLSLLPVFVSQASARAVSRVCVDLQFLLGPASGDCVAAVNPLPNADAELERARRYDLRPFADATWFDTGHTPRHEGIQVAASDGAVRISGDAGVSILPRSVLLTSGRARRPIALVWAKRSGDWAADLPLERIRSVDGPIDVWVLRGHARHFTYLGDATLPGNFEPLSAARTAAPR